LVLGGDRERLIVRERRRQSNRSDRHAPQVGEGRSIAGRPPCWIETEGALDRPAARRRDDGARPIEEHEMIRSWPVR